MTTMKRTRRSVPSPRAATVTTCRGRWFRLRRRHRIPTRFDSERTASVEPRPGSAPTRGGPARNRQRVWVLAPAPPADTRPHRHSLPHEHGHQHERRQRRGRWANDASAIPARSRLGSGLDGASASGTAQAVAADPARPAASGARDGAGRRRGAVRRAAGRATRWRLRVRRRGAHCGSGDLARLIGQRHAPWRGGHPARSPVSPSACSRAW